MLDLSILLSLTCVPVPPNTALTQSYFRRAVLIGPNTPVTTVVGPTPITEVDDADIYSRNLSSMNQNH